ncbi:hypothetical protein BDC45DRAFT_533595 [Circinella umbellata]|nr:hypothetical protein BDC45DRAFT_533595 [Circinella umbellata]
METNSNTSNDQLRLPSSSAPVMWHTNFTLGEDGSMVSIPNQEQSTTPEASSHGTDNIEETVDGEKEQECESLSLLEERCAMLMEEHRQKKESLALELRVSLEEVEKRCGNHVAKLLTTTKARSGWNSFISTKRQEELDSAEANQAQLAEETLEEGIKRYSVAYKEPGVADHFKSVAEKYNLGTGLKGQSFLSDCQKLSKSSSQFSCSKGLSILLNSTIFIYCDGKVKKTQHQKHKGDKKSLPEDTQWCLSNLRNLTTRKFYDAFGHENEHNIWMKSKKNTNYWLEKIREETVSNTHIEGARYVQDVVRSEIDQIRTMDNKATEYHEDEQNKINETEEDESVEVEPWIMENGINVTSLFTEYYQRVEQFVKTEGLIPIEPHVQELSALNHILVLKPLQHSNMIREVFTDENIEYITNEQLKTSMNSSLDFTSDELTQLNLVLKHLINQTQSVHNIATNLMVFSNSLDYEKRRVIIGIAMLNTLLRWLNKQAEDDLSRPDASLTMINQLQFGFNLGFGEVKISQPTCDKAALCNDFVRLTHLTKECLDNHLLDASFSFQIHGFSVSFYMTQLPCHKLYTMTELGKVPFPKSLKDISAFCCPQNLQFLIQVTNAF